MTTDALQFRALVEDSRPTASSPWETILSGLSHDDYGCEEQARATRRGLETLASTPGRRVQLCTRSPLVLRDLDLLRHLDGMHTVSVDVALPSVDAAVARRLEGDVPTPTQRLRTVAELSAAGLAVQVLWSPVVPGVNTGVDDVDELFAAARRVGAHDVKLQKPAVSPLGRLRLLHRSERNDASVEHIVRSRFDAWGRLREFAARRLGDLFERRRLAHGFPRAMPGRG